MSMPEEEKTVSSCCFVPLTRDGLHCTKCGEKCTKTWPSCPLSICNGSGICSAPALEDSERMCPHTIDDDYEGYD